MPNHQAEVLDFLTSVRNETGLSPGLKQKAEALSTKKANGPVYEQDLWIYRAVIIVLGTIILATVIGGLGLAFKGDTNYKLPAEIVAIGSTAVGALAGLLAPAPNQKQ